MSVAEIDEGVFESTATIDNGSFGTRTIRFETGRLAQQAAGAVVAYLDDETMLLSATTASKTPKDHFDFFPLTIDVEERMYAAGRIPGSFFRREGRPSTDAILTCRLIDRPLRPTFVSGLRNEIQVVVTILSLDPKDLYDVLAINAASASTQISGSAVLRSRRRRACRPHRTASGLRSPPSSSSRRQCSTWSSRAAGPVIRRFRCRDHDGRGRGHRQRHRADRGRRGRTDRGRRGRGPGGRQAVHRRTVQGAAGAGRRRRQGDRRVPGVPRLPGRRLLLGVLGGHRGTVQGAVDRRQGRARRPHRRDQGRGARAPGRDLLPAGRRRSAPRTGR